MFKAIINTPPMRRRRTGIILAAAIAANAGSEAPQIAEAAPALPAAPAISVIFPIADIDAAQEHQANDLMSPDILDEEYAALFTKDEIRSLGRIDAVIFNYMDDEGYLKNQTLLEPFPGLVRARIDTAHITRHHYNFETDTYETKQLELSPNFQRGYFWNNRKGHVDLRGISPHLNNAFATTRGLSNYETSLSIALHETFHQTADESGFWQRHSDTIEFNTYNLEVAADIGMAYYMAAIKGKAYTLSFVDKWIKARDVQGHYCHHTMPAMTALRTAMADDSWTAPKTMKAAEERAQDFIADYIPNEPQLQQRVSACRSMLSNVPPPAPHALG